LTLTPLPAQVILGHLCQLTTSVKASLTFWFRIVEALEQYKMYDWIGNSIEWWLIINERLCDTKKGSAQEISDRVTGGITL
jgi:hypothetical protein